LGFAWRAVLQLLSAVNGGYAGRSSNGIEHCFQAFDPMPVFRKRHWQKIPRCRRFAQLKLWIIEGFEAFSTLILYLGQ